MSTIKRLASQIITDVHHGNLHNVSCYNNVVDLVRLTGKVHIAIQYGQITTTPPNHKEKWKFRCEKLLETLRKI